MPSIKGTTQRMALLTPLALVAAAAIMGPAAAVGATTARLGGSASVLVAANSTHENGPLVVSAVTVVDGVYGQFEVARVRRHGASYSFLTDLPNGAFNPDFTPDGTRLLFWSPVDNAPDGIFSVPVGGGPISQIHTNCSQDPNCLGDDNPAVSPDGRELLAVRAVGPFDDNQCVAFVGVVRFRIDGSHAKKLSPTGPACTGDFEPRWSPDGQQIVFMHQYVTGLSSLWVMNADGSHRRRITPDGMDVGTPDWSPDGHRIVFQSPAEAPDDQTPQQLYTIHPDGTHLVQITHYAPEPGLIVKTNGARWSPDGHKIVFAHLDGTTTIGPDGLHHADLFVMNADGTHVVQINATLEKDNMPAWGPRATKDGS
jgi:Tol biopolymer transport system component